jgi:hypothetical protein
MLAVVVVVLTEWELREVAVLVGVEMEEAH